VADDSKHVSIDMT